MDEAAHDATLIARLAGGDPDALEPLYDRYGGVALGVIVRVVGDRRVAEELVQETFLRLWQQADRFDPEQGRLLPWLLTIGHRLALNEVRRRGRRPREVTAPRWDDTDDQLPTIADPAPEPPEAAWTMLRRAAVLQAMDGLPEAQRVVLDLYTAGHSQSEIAARLGEPLGTVKTRMRRGLLRLRGQLAPEGLEAE